MTDRAQFEAMLEALINEDQETAKEIFHNIVVGKSREIYEELLAEDFDLEEKYEEEEEESVKSEAFGEEDSADDEEDSADDEEGADDEAPDFGADDEEGAEGEGDIEDRVLDLEDALDELKAEFEQLMAGEEEEGHHGDEFGGDEFGGDEFGSDDLGAEFGGDEQEVDEFAGLMEYKNKVAPPKHGDNGQNTKSPVAKKNDMGGTTANIVKGGESTTGGTKGGLLAPNTKEENFGNVNVPGGKGATKLSPVKGGHGAEKKGTAPDQDKSAGSPLNGVKSRAK